MKSVGTRNALIAALVCAAGTGAALILGVPLLAMAGAVAAGAYLVARNGRGGSGHGKRKEPAPAHGLEQTALLETLARDVARAERYGEPLTVCMVRAEGYETMTPPQQEAVSFHLGSTVERVTRASDSWFDVGEARFAIILERCNTAEANAFAQRVAFAAGSRPVIAGGERVPLDVTAANTAYDAHQFVGVPDYIAAIASARFATPGQRRRLVSDGRFLREQLYGRDTAGAA